MSEATPQLEKTITKTYFGCPICKKKMETITIGSGDFAFLNVGSSKAMYCNNQSCERFGLLTVAGFRIEEH